MLGRPGEECPAEDLLGNDPFTSAREGGGIDGSSVKIVPLTRTGLYV